MTNDNNMNEADKRRIIEETAEFIKRCCGSEFVNEAVDEAVRRNDIYRLEVCLRNISIQLNDITVALLAVQADEEKATRQKGNNEARQEVGKTDLQPDRE